MSARAADSTDAARLQDIGCCNLQWALALLTGMIDGGLRQLVLSPGARSTPLVIAAQRLEQAGRLVLTPVLDERSAAFFALGLARAALRPVALVATSGSAPAHWYPAVIEAAQVGLPLLLLTADRPPRLRAWGANQTIDQTRLFGAFVREFHDPGLPQAGAAALEAQRALGRRSAEVSQARDRGPVHLNLPFDEPLVPGRDCAAAAADGVTAVEADLRRARPGAAAAGTSDASSAAAAVPGSPTADAAMGCADASEADRPAMDAGGPSLGAGRRAASASGAALAGVPTPVSQRATLSGWPLGRGLIVCGPGAEMRTPVSAGSGHSRALTASLWACADALALPVLVDPLSGLRTGPGGAGRISAYDAILRNPAAAAALRPDWVLRLGSAPVSKVLGQWLEGIPLILADTGGHWPDPGHDAIVRLELPAAVVCDALVAQQLVTRDAAWLQRWQAAEQRAWALANAAIDPWLPAASAAHEAPLPWCEAQVVQQLRRLIPDGEALFCANSMPIRQLDTWWRGGGPQVALLGNRGASGIDGYLSTLAGLAAAGLHCWGLTGDLSLCHDLSGLLLAKRLDRPLLVLNNGGGHIFDYLPQHGLPEFERLWQTPQPVALAALAELAGLRYWPVADGVGLEAALAALGLGPGLIEIRVDPQASRRGHRAHWARIARTPLLAE